MFSFTMMFQCCVPLKKKNFSKLLIPLFIFSLVKKQKQKGNIMSGLFLLLWYPVAIFEWKIETSTPETCHCSKFLHTCDISHFWHMVFRLHWWAKAAVDAGRVSQWVSSDRRERSSTQRTEAAQDCGAADFPSQLEEREKSFTKLQLKKQVTTKRSEFWTSDRRRKKFRLGLLDDVVINWPLSAGSHKRRKGEKWMWPQVIVVSIVWVNLTQQEVCFTVDLYPLWLPQFPDVSGCRNISLEVKRHWRK